MALDRETVVRTALRVLDDVGLDGLTLRRIASELGVQPPALYWHFKNKQELVDEMAAAVLADTVRDFAPGADAGWEEWALQFGHALRRMLLGHRDGAKVFSGTYLTDTDLYRPMEAALRTFTDAGFSLAGATGGMMTIYCYTVGFAIEEQAVHPRPGEPDPRYDVARRAERLDAETLPLARAAGQELFTGFDERFTRGLQLIIAGLRASLAG